MLWDPNQGGIIGSTLSPGKIPVLEIPKAPGMTVQESKVRAAIVNVGMDVVLLRNAGNAAVVEQPDRRRRPAEGANLHRPVFCSCAVDMLVEAIVEKVDAI